MEHQKVLWIIFSVTLFLLVVVVVGFIWFLPPEDGAEDALSRIAGRPGNVIDQLDPIEWVREGTEVPGISVEDEGSPEDNDLLLVYGESESEAALEVNAESDTADAIAVAVQERLSTRPAALMTDKPAIRSVPETQEKPKATPPAEPKPVRVTQYWIQAGSFKSRSRAEDTQIFLADKGWNTRIISRDVDDATYFRIRIGPYESEGEAEKFLNWIRGIDSFENSYISQVYTTRMMN